MSTLSIVPYFPFSRVRLTRQSISDSADRAWLEAEPDRRYQPVCYACGKPASGVHGWVKRAIRDLNLGQTRVWIGCAFRKVYCASCQRTRVEDLEFFEPYRRVTKRLARYIHELCKMVTVKDAADHLGLNWKTVARPRSPTIKQIDKMFLEKTYGQTDYTNLEILAVDEIAIRKGHRYMTVVLDYLTGRVVWIGKNRQTETLLSFFNGMSPEQKQHLRAIALDMWDPYIKGVQEAVPHVQIVFDLFHVVSAFNKVIDEVRNDEFLKASKKDKTVFKGTKYLLLKNRRNIRHRSEWQHLRQLLALNETISTVMILKDLLRQIWTYRSRGWANRRIDEWCALARTIDHPSIIRFANMLEHYRYGILNHCNFPIHTSKLEGVNNTIKVIKRNAYGFHDNRYFALKVIQAFHPLNRR